MHRSPLRASSGSGGGGEGGDGGDGDGDGRGGGDGGGGGPDFALLFLPRVHFSRLCGRAKQIDQTSQSVGRIPTLVGFCGPSFTFLCFWS